MEGYLGETIVKQENTEFKDYTDLDRVLYFIGSYGQIDGDHHKLWTLDQVARILNGTKIIIKEARWKNGHKEYRISLEKPSKKYKTWVEEMKDGEDGPETYSYDEGIAP